MRISDWSSDVCSSDLGGSRRRSVVTTKQSRKPPLHDDAPGLVALRLIGAVGGVEADHRAFAAEIFERRVLPVDERDDDIALARGVRLLDQRIIAIENAGLDRRVARDRSEEHTSELQSLMRTSYAVFCLTKK